MERSIMYKIFTYLLLTVLIFSACSGGSSSDSSPSEPSAPNKPTLAFTPEETYKDSYTVQVLGEKYAKVYLNGVEVATLLSNGKAYLDLNTSGDYNTSINFDIMLENSLEKKSETLSFSIKKIKAKTTRLDAIKLLRQASFTSYETQIDEVMLNGEMAWIDKQLATIGAHDDPNDKYYGYLEQLLRRKYDINDALGRSIIENPEENFPAGASSSWNLQTFWQSIFQERVYESEDQLRQRMALALSEIIVISPAATAGSALNLKPESLIKLYDELYKHSFGNYRDILKETCMSSAMAYYLTYLGNKKEDAVTNTAPDENFARELMQLFSIGVYKLNLDGSKKIGTDGNPVASYTQEDVSELAKVFTGWDWWHNGAFGDTYGNQTGNQFNLLHDIEFNSQWHDNGTKEVLGQSIAATDDGEGEIDAVIDILMNNPNMAPHVSRHLIMRFITSNPTPEYVARVATVFNDNGNGVKGDLKATLEAIIKDDEARGVNAPNDFGKVDTLLLAFTHYTSRFDGRAAPYLYIDGEKKYNIYYYKWDRWIANLPLSAGSVFNFYTNEDAPTDSYFSDNKLVAPELTAHSYTNARYFMGVRINGVNGIPANLNDFYEEVDLNGTTLHHNDATTPEEWLDSTKMNLGLFMNSRDVYEDFLPLWQDTEGTGVTKEEAINELIDLLSVKLLGRALPADYKDKIYQVHKNRTKLPIHLFRDITRMILSSPYFMVLD